MIMTIFTIFNYKIKLIVIEIIYFFRQNKKTFYEIRLSKGNFHLLLLVSIS